MHRPPQAAKAIVFFRIGSGDGGRAFLREILDQVPSASETALSETMAFHISLTWSGLAKLLMGHDTLDVADGRSQLEPAFVDPDEAFSHPRELGFIGESAPESWWDGAWTAKDLDLGVHVFARDADLLSTEIDRLRARAADLDLTALKVPSFNYGTPAGRTPKNGIVHFGFRDGITSPDIDWNEDGSGTIDRREVLLGDGNEHYPLAPSKDGPWKDFVRDGSMACVAWISQDVAAFETFLKVAADEVRGLAPAGRERDWLAARVMGRWPDGSPVVRWPDSPPASPDHDDTFGFASDGDGRVCPLNAHIRVANLRDDKMTFANRLVFPKGPPRFIRRGFTYGPDYTPGDDPSLPRGLVGTFFCARINEQFLKVLRWMQKTDFNEGFRNPPYTSFMQDACFGQRDPQTSTTYMPIGSGPFVPKVELSRFMAFRGVAVLFMPSLPSLALLATGPTRPPPRPSAPRS